ncbi:Hypothetical predicted protein [Podarcis lilfordi]|uniref:Uncharacterized protein n=1 Tax=Podarcis lilfordi TaxID=74358 RepID=A0AA35KC03_9SAUR|nr:Hypothetical predicted protein [Podarcis lilfordi]
MHPQVPRDTCNNGFNLALIHPFYSEMEKNKSISPPGPPILSPQEAVSNVSSIEQLSSFIPQCFSLLSCFFPQQCSVLANAFMLNIINQRSVPPLPSESTPLTASSCRKLCKAKASLKYPEASTQLEWHKVEQRHLSLDARLRDNNISV